ncbi:SDR family NAD(P)-dependent oxidoreductase [Nocardiopsis lucentensis]|uniref:SDR family NAD(P)-dependent oxidoreductase n=1 Tax=Nocardiopsis lucentensis TaxID=53441 RepID=UPI00037E2DCD
MDGMLTQFAREARALGFAPPRIPVMSTLTGGLATEETLCTADYWVRQVREPVRFLDGVRTMRADGTDTFIELGPDGVLSAMIGEYLDREPEERSRESVCVLPLLRHGVPETGAPGRPGGFERALATAHVHGAAVSLSDEPGPDVLAVASRLPTYAFRRDRYWLDLPAGRAGAPSAGLDDPAHPLLSAAVDLPEGRGTVWTGSLSTAALPWAADHSVHGRTVVPGSALLDLALHATARVGELTFEAPLVLPEEGGVRLRVVLDAPDEHGSREVRVHSSDGDGGWIRHAVGTLEAADEPVAPVEGVGAVWPPEAAESVDPAEEYARFGAAGIGYGPAFRGLRAAWRHEGDLLAEVRLPDDLAEEAHQYGIHPVLLDTALHATAHALGGAHGLLPFTWREVTLHSRGARALRVRLRPSGADTVAVTAVDPENRPVFSARALALRPVSAETVAAAEAARAPLYRLRWSEHRGGRDVPPAAPVVVGSDAAPLAEQLTHLPDLAEVARGGAVPRHVLADLRGDGTGTPTGFAETALSLVQEWLAAEEFADSELVLVTRRAVDTGDGVGDPASATVWGLVRAAQSEHPGRFALLDTDDTDASRAALTRAVGTADQLALRGGLRLTPALTRFDPAPAPEPDGDAESHGGAPAWSTGTVLVTGGTGGLGAEAARHLVTAHGARRLLLTSRRGTRAPGADGLVAELSGLGAEVEVAACDVADRDALRDLLERIPAEHPLTAVVHTAGVVDDGVVTAQDPERLAMVFRPKVAAVRNLHDLTVGRHPSAFVLYSSAAGVLGSAGQSAYAAANAYLDSFASWRRGLGLPAVALGWGPWEGGGMAGALDGADSARLRRGGLTPLSRAEGLAVLDTVLTGDGGGGVPAQLVPARFDVAALRGSGTAPPVLHGLVGAARPPSGAATQETAPDAVGTETDRIVGLPRRERRAALVEFVRAEVAAVLGHPTPASVEVGRSFKEAGFDSLTAVELRNRLRGSTGLRLPATLVFDHPTPLALAERIDGELPGAETALLEAIDALRDRIDEALTDDDTDDGLRDDVERRLRSLLTGLPRTREAPTSTDDGPGDAESVTERLHSASDDELFALFDSGLSP